MSAQDEMAAPDIPGETELTEKAEEQVDASAYGAELLRLAAEEGHVIGLEAPPAEPEPDTLEEVPATEPDVEESGEEKPEEEKAEEEKPEVKREEWPQSAKVRVAEETAKRRRANERAEKAEALAAQLQSQIEQAVAPRPTEDDPLRDIQDRLALERLELSYEKAIDLADDNPDGAIDVPVGKNPDGSEKLADFTPEQLRVIRAKADKALRKFIPQRREYLAQREIANAEAFKIYPEFKDPDSEFIKVANFVANELTSGNALKAPNLLTWVGHAVRGYQESLKRNGAPGVKSPGSKRIVESARTKIAPTPTRTRSFVERGNSSVNLEKAKKELEEKGTADAAEKYVAALFSSRGGSKKLEPLAE